MVERTTRKGRKIRRGILRTVTPKDRLTFNEWAVYIRTQSNALKGY